MNIKYFKSLIKKAEEYNKKATNPFLKGNFEANPIKPLHEQTYIWVIKENKDN